MSCFDTATDGIMELQGNESSRSTPTCDPNSVPNSSEVLQDVRSALGRYYYGSNSVNVNKPLPPLPDTAIESEFHTNRKQKRHRSLGSVWYKASPMTSNLTPNNDQVDSIKPLSRTPSITVIPYHTTNSYFRSSTSTSVDVAQSTATQRLAKSLRKSVRKFKDFVSLKMVHIIRTRKVEIQAGSKAEQVDCHKHLTSVPPTTFYPQCTLIDLPVESKQPTRHPSLSRLVRFVLRKKPAHGDNDRSVNNHVPVRPPRPPVHLCPEPDQNYTPPGFRDRTKKKEKVVIGFLETPDIVNTVTLLRQREIKRALQSKGATGEPKTPPSGSNSLNSSPVSKPERQTYVSYLDLQSPQPKGYRSDSGSHMIPAMSFAPISPVLSGYTKALPCIPNDENELNPCFLQGAVRVLQPVYRIVNLRTVPETAELDYESSPSRVSIPPRSQLRPGTARVYKEARIRKLQDNITRKGNIQESPFSNPEIDLESSSLMDKQGDTIRSLSAYPFLNAAGSYSKLPINSPSGDQLIEPSHQYNYPVENQLRNTYQKEWEDDQYPVVWRNAASSNVAESSKQAEQRAMVYYHASKKAGTIYGSGKAEPVCGRAATDKIVTPERPSFQDVQIPCKKSANSIQYDERAVDTLKYQSLIPSPLRVKKTPPRGTNLYRSSSPQLLDDDKSLSSIAQYRQTSHGRDFNGRVHEGDVRSVENSSPASVTITPITNRIFTGSTIANYNINSGDHDSIYSDVSAISDYNQEDFEKRIKRIYRLSVQQAKEETEEGKSRPTTSFIAPPQRKGTISDEKIQTSMNTKSSCQTSTVYDAMHDDYKNNFFKMYRSATSTIPYYSYPIPRFGQLAPKPSPALMTARTPPLHQRTKHCTLACQTFEKFAPPPPPVYETIAHLRRSSSSSMDLPPASDTSNHNHYTQALTPHRHLNYDAHLQTQQFVQDKLKDKGKSKEVIPDDSRNEIYELEQMGVLNDGVRSVRANDGNRYF